MGRVSPSHVVEAAQTLGGPELLLMARQQGGRLPDPGAVVENLETRPASTLRRCRRLPYQSQTHGHWTGPLVDALQVRGRLLAGRPGPKGRRYRAWTRRVGRVDSQAGARLAGREQRWGPRFRREADAVKRLRRVSRHMRGRFWCSHALTSEGVGWMR